MTSWGALLAAMAQTDPACLGDERFTDDHTSAAELAPICDSCPLFAECRAAVDSAARGQVWGVMAGRERRIKKQIRDRTVSEAE